MGTEVQDLVKALSDFEVEIKDSALDSHPHGRQRAIADYLRAAGWPVKVSDNSFGTAGVERGRLNVMRNSKGDGFIYQWLNG